jgi:hypothetical protein
MKKLKINGRWLSENIRCCEHISKSKGVYKVRFPYFYRSGTVDGVKAKVEQQLTEKGIPHTILDANDYWAPFKGSASVAKQSHLWVTFTINE